jgi:enamine deaminase RidA (YjgF/YER057c/UK114 family)
MIGWDAQEAFPGDGSAGQVRASVPEHRGCPRGSALPEHIVRMTWYVVDKREYLAALREIGIAYREILGRHFPAMTAVQVAALVEDQARVEIEVTAVVPE